jgi:hypothetical protein
VVVSLRQWKLVLGPHALEPAEQGVHVAPPVVPVVPVELVALEVPVVPVVLEVEVVPVELDAVVLVPVVPDVACGHWQYPPALHWTPLQSAAVPHRLAESQKPDAKLVLQKPLAQSDDAAQPSQMAKVPPVVPEVPVVDDVLLVAVAVEVELVVEVVDEVPVVPVVSWGHAHWPLATSHCTTLLQSAGAVH